MAKRTDKPVPTLIEAIAMEQTDRLAVLHAALVRLSAAVESAYRSEAVIKALTMAGKNGELAAALDEALTALTPNP